MPRKKDIASTLEECLRIILTPIVKFCLRHSISIQALIEGCKVTIIEAAAEEIERTGKEPTISRLRVITGLHRRDVARIYRDEEPIEASEGYITGTIGLWQHNPKFLTKSGKPRVLSYENEESEFTHLVSLVSKDVHAGAVLFRLEQLGAVEKSPRGLKLLSQTYNPKNDPIEGFQLYARDANYLLRAIEENIWTHKRVKNHHIMTEYTNVRVDELANARKWLWDKGNDFHRKARQYLSKFDQDINPKKGKNGGGRVYFGSFGWVGKTEE